MLQTLEGECQYAAFLSFWTFWNWETPFILALLVLQAVSSHNGSGQDIW